MIRVELFQGLNNKLSSDLLRGLGPDTKSSHSLHFIIFTAMEGFKKVNRPQKYTKESSLSN